MKKYLKKISALLVAMAMVMAMCTTAMAATNTIGPNYPNEIKIHGLASGDSTTLKVYQIVSLDADANEWVVADWAKGYVTERNGSFTIDEAGLKNAVGSASVYMPTTTTSETDYTFSNVPVGAYLILASGAKATYNLMVANTYKADETYMASVDVDVYAKTSGYDVKKEADDNFVGRGETVTFTVTTTFPSFEVANSTENSYKIVDTPIGLEINGVESVTIGGTTISGITGSYDANKTNYTIDLTDQIGDENANAGKVVVVKYTATVTSDDGYSNTANASRNDETMGTGTEGGHTGDITVTKYAEDGATTLDGAEFKVYAVTSQEAEVEEGATAIKFVKVSDGVYKKALEDEEDATDTVVATNGTVKVTGLGEGFYHFEETKAPKGYSINAEGVTVEVQVNETTNVSARGSLKDTKLSTLPSTGGIGTYLFTIIGVVIMAVAAGIFFMKRRRNAE